MCQVDSSLHGLLCTPQQTKRGEWTYENHIEEQLKKPLELCQSNTNPETKNKTRTSLQSSFISISDKSDTYKSIS